MRVSRSRSQQASRRGVGMAVAGQRETKARAQGAAARGVSFQEHVVALEREWLEEELEADLALIDERAERLKESPTPEHFAAFKEAVKSALERIVPQAYQVEEVRSFHRLGRQRISHWVKIVDDRLDELAGLVSAKTREVTEIVRLIDEIKGLLVDARR